MLLSLGLNLPAAAGLAAISLPLVAVVLGHGAFDAQAVSATALALCAYAPGLPAYALSRPLLAACHALESGLPLKAAAIALAVALAGGYALTLRFGAWGPPLGVSVGLWCNAALLWIGLSRRVSLRLALRSLAVQLAGTAPDLRERLWRCPLGRARLEHRAAGPCHTSRGSRVRRLPAHRRPELVPPLEKAIVHLEHFLFTLPYFKGH